MTLVYLVCLSSIIVSPIYTRKGTSHDEPPPFVAVEERQPLITTTPAYGTEPPRIYQYSNLLSDEQVASLPPGHPQMACVQAGMHDLHTTFGLLGAFPYPLPLGWSVTVPRNLGGRLLVPYWYRMLSP